MRLCVSLFRGAAAPLGCVIFFASAEVAACTLRTPLCKISSTGEIEQRFRLN